MRRIMRAAGLLLAAAGALGALALRAAAEPPPGASRERRPSLDRMLERDAGRLGLDAATRGRVREIADAARAASEPLERRRDELHREMRTLLDQDEPELDAVMDQAERIGALDTELRKRHLAALLEIRALLTPAQREELVRIHEERRAAHGHRRRTADPDAAAPAAP